MFGFELSDSFEKPVVWPAVRTGRTRRHRASEAASYDHVTAAENM